MVNAALALTLILILTFALGMIRPSVVIRWGSKRTRGKVILCYGIPMIACWIWFGISADKAQVHGIAMGDKLWEQGQKAEAVKEYAQILPILDKSKTAGVCERIMSYCVENGEWETAEKALDRVVSRGVALSPDGQQLANRIIAEIKRKEQESAKTASNYLAAKSGQHSPEQVTEALEKELANNNRKSQSETARKPVGVTYDEVIHDLSIWFPKMDYSPLDDGTPRYTGLMENNLGSLQITGNKSNISSVFFMFGIPVGDNWAITQNILISHALMKNTVPEWPNSARNSWYEDALRAMTQESADKVTKVIGDKKITLSCARALGVVFLLINHS